MSDETRETEENGYEEYLSSPFLSADYGPPPAGVIRPGIMVLKKGCTEQDHTIYDKGVAEGCTWDEIDRTLGLDGQRKSKLVPRNVDYFSIHDGEVTDADWAKRIRDKYSDSDGNIRKIPVWFAANDWWDIIPHSLKCWSGGALRYCAAFRTIKNSEGQPDRKRVCEYFADGPERKRIFGGRTRLERPCDPDSCPEYQRDECKFSGLVRFYIAGIPGGPWVIPTRSWYSINGIYATLKEVKKITRGRVTKLWLNGAAVFQLRKIKAPVSHVNSESGQAEKKHQYLIRLEPTVDLMELAWAFEHEAILSRGRSAASVLSAEIAPSQTAGEMTKPETAEPQGDRQKTTMSAEQKKETNANIQEQDQGTIPGTQQPPEKEAVGETPGKNSSPPPAQPSASANGKNGTSGTNSDENRIKGERLKATIIEHASRYGISEQRAREVIATLKTFKDAEAVINELKRGDTSRFLKGAGGNEERY